MSLPKLPDDLPDREGFSSPSALKWAQEATKLSEAVALVRKLVEAIRTLRGPAMDEALKEAEAFLAREGK